MNYFLFRVWVVFVFPLLDVRIHEDGQETGKESVKILSRLFTSWYDG